MLPDCPDDELLDELNVIVTTGWDLPGRPRRAEDVRHLLLLTDASGSTTYREASQRLLLLLDDALRSAGDQLLAEDERTGCRILLGVHPAYRSISSPTTRRANAAELLVPSWQNEPPRDPAGTFQRRHQRSALRQVLTCLRLQYGQDSTEDNDYDVVQVNRWYTIDAHRQLSANGETAECRIRRDGFTTLELLGAEVDAENLESSDFAIQPFGDETPSKIALIETDVTKPGFRRSLLTLPRTYYAGEILSLAWREIMHYGPRPPNWQRYWVTMAGLNDSFKLTVTVSFDPAQLPDACWWFSAEPVTDPGEIGPDSPSHLIDVAATSTASHSWSPSDTERRRYYGLNWVWLEEEEDRAEWDEVLRRLGQ